MIPEYELLDLYAAHQVLERLAAGELYETLEKRSGNVQQGRRCCIGGLSYHTRIYDQDGQEQGRVHYLECAFGLMLAVYPSTIILDGVLYHRQGHQRRPPPAAEGASP